MRPALTGVLLSAALAGGCASIGTDGIQKAGRGAAYQYEKTSDSCKLVITSARDFPKGIVAAVGADCSVVVATDAVSGDKILSELIERIPTLSGGGR